MRHPGILLAVLWLASPPEARAFCGFYVGRADASLFNSASQVALVRDGDRTVISMLNDYQGDLKEFALVVPVPVVLEKGQIHVGDAALFKHLDAYSAPRLVEYFDADPCARELTEKMRVLGDTGGVMASGVSTARTRSLGVAVEAQYTVGEYDIVILSAKVSDGLETWLHENGYRVPKGASRALQPYVRQGMKFFVARVNLEEQVRIGATYLRPLQFAFESEKFMLPIRLGMMNARGPQDLVVYALTRTGRVETTNYRTVMLPTGMEIPEYVKESFPDFYKAMFNRQVQRENGRAVFTEYVWNMGWCDPCAADPLSPQEMRALGVFWLDDPGSRQGVGPGFGGKAPGWGFGRAPASRPAGGPTQVILTRLHLRYSAETFPEDLVFQETGDQQNFQGRYVLQHPWTGAPDACPAAAGYFEELQARREKRAETLANLTGWDIDAVRSKMEIEAPRRWWETLWR
ncbi:MAG TPA: DUF2330 domain-containing protein [Candidatus Dormibacteraeota bacterium]|nr:DUF2330 domain-containing protein [Candidatus Dormibacteraeota bacterium]